MVFLLIVTAPFVSVDMIETNHVYNADGSKRFTQTIFWDLAKDGRYHVRAYVLNGAVQVARHRLGHWSAVWIKDGRLREVRSLTWHETHTMYDIEIIDRKWVPIEKRRRLWK